LSRSRMPEFCAGKSAITSQPKKPSQVQTKYPSKLHDSNVISSNWSRPTDKRRLYVIKRPAGKPANSDITSRDSTQQNKASRMSTNTPNKLTDHKILIFDVYGTLCVCLDLPNSVEPCLMKPSMILGLGDRSL
jgi:hypothetical protein